MTSSIRVAWAALPVAICILFGEHSVSLAQTSPVPTASLKAGKTEVILQFPGAASAKTTLNAAEVERMIDTLAEMRAAMNPPRPMADPAAGTKINVATDGRWHVQPDGTGVDLDVLHPGYGWVGILMDRRSVEDLNRVLYRSIHPVEVKAREKERHHLRRE